MLQQFCLSWRKRNILFLFPLYRAFFRLSIGWSQNIQGLFLAAAVGSWKIFRGCGLGIKADRSFYGHRFRRQFFKKHLDRKKILCYNAKCSIMEGVAIDGTRKGFRLLWRSVFPLLSCGSSAISAERSGLFYLFAPIKEAFSGSYLCECAKCVEKGFSPVYNSTVTSML